MQDFDNAAKFQNDFGTGQNGVLLKQLDNALKSDTPKSNQMLRSFANFHATELTKASNKFPLYALILMSIADRVDSQSLFDQSFEIAQENKHPWEDYPDGHSSYQKLAKQEWIKIARKSSFASHLSNCEKIDFTAHLLFRGKDSYATRDIEELSKKYDQRPYGRQIVRAALDKFPDDGNIAASYVALSPLRGRKELVKQYASQFPDINRFTQLPVLN